MFIVANEGGQDVGETSGDRGRRGGGRGDKNDFSYQWTHRAPVQIDVAAVLKLNFQFLLLYTYAVEEERRR